MPKFIHPFEKAFYLEQALFLYSKNTKYLEDDYSGSNSQMVQYFLNLILNTLPFFYLIVEDDEVSGLVYLENITGNEKKLHSAELTTCFDRRFWGSYTKICAEYFLIYCFEVLGFEKIKALVYPENFRVKNILEKSGFKKEACLKKETIRGNKFQDIEIYSRFKSY